MERLINLCVLPSLVLSLFFAVMILLSPAIDAQSSTNCFGENRCEKWNNVSNGVITAQCVYLSCSQSRNVTSCNVQKCERILSSCGEGSSWEEPSFQCAADNQSASTRYFCASENVSHVISQIGPGLCGAGPSPTPTPTPTPCTARLGDFCSGPSDCCWDQICNTETNQCAKKLIATQGDCESAGSYWNLRPIPARSLLQHLHLHRATHRRL